MKTPNPGSGEAAARGCTCAVWDNHHGLGYRGNPKEFVITEGCPLHAPKKKEENVPTKRLDTRCSIERPCPVCCAYRDRMDGLRSNP